jgi:hypothetical protein
MDTYEVPVAVMCERDEDLLKLLVRRGILRKVENENSSNVPTVILKPLPEVKLISLPVENSDTYGNPYLSNHLPIESNFEAITKECLGMSEDRKQWTKELKAAVKEFGHDEVLNAFYFWASSQGTFMGRRPITFFLKNIGSHISYGDAARKPSVTNPALDRVCQKVAYVSDNKVFFTGEYRVKLALLIKDFGEELVLTAFTDFYQDIEDRNIQWAARNFLERASVMVSIIAKKREEAKAQENLLKVTYQKATENVEVLDEEEDEL